MVKRGLGRGLDALISGALADETEGTVREIRLDEIVANPYQPRKIFDPEKLGELVRSIREHGILQPVLVRRVGVDRYELVAGERRVRAAREAGLKAIPALIREYEEVSRLEVALIENLQREDINPVEAATAYQRLREEFGMTQDQIAKRVGKSQPTIANTLRLLALPQEVLNSLERGEISEGHARTILQAPPHMHVSVWKSIRTRGMSVRDTEKHVRDLGESPARVSASRKPVAGRDPNQESVEEALQESLGTKVLIQTRTGGAGKIEIEFYSEDHLEALIERLMYAGGGE